MTGSNLVEIQKMMETNDFVSARSALERLLADSPDNPTLLEMLAVVELESLADGSPDKAYEYLTKAVKLCPDLGFGKYLYLAQLSNEYSAVQLYERGLQLIEKDLHVASEAEANLLKKKASSALCSLVEIFMTDLCFDPNAEAKCEEYIGKALELEPNDSEVLQTLASIRLSQCRTDEATDAIVKAVGVWIEEEPTSPLFPCYNTRISQAKLLMEVGQHDLALDVLKTAQMENDEDIEVWYLFAWSYYILGGGTEETPNVFPKMEEEQLAFFEDARECFVKTLQTFQATGQGEIEIVQHSEQLFAYVNGCLVAHGREALTIDSVIIEDMDDEEGWENMDEEDDEEAMDM